MNSGIHFHVDLRWESILLDIGIKPNDVLNAANLPMDFFSKNDSLEYQDQYIEVWRILERLVDDQELPLLIGKHISVTSFAPPVLACSYCANFNTAILRLNKFKRIPSPYHLEANIGIDRTSIRVGSQLSSYRTPNAWFIMQMVLMTQFLRSATRMDIKPIEVSLTQRPKNIAMYEEFWGVNIRMSEYNQVVFSRNDTEQTFTSEHENLCEYFQLDSPTPQTDVRQKNHTTQRVKKLLLEVLPVGESRMSIVASRLAMSKRTLQRRLSEEGECFKSVLNATRQQLAQHYLENSSMPLGEISFLLGFQDSSSFTRAFSRWTGRTPGSHRKIHYSL